MPNRSRRLSKLTAVSGLLVAFVWSANGQLVEDMVDAPVVLSTPSTVTVGKVVTIDFVSAPLTEITSYSGVALQGYASGDSLRGWIQFNGRSDWESLYIVRSATDSAFLAAFRGQIMRNSSQPFTLRFEISSGDSVAILSAGVFLDTGEEDEEHAAEFRDTGVNVIVAPTLITRRQWGAEPFIGTPQPLNRPNYTRMTLHHTAGFSAVTRAEGIEQVKRIQEFHQNGRGWRDIGYQFLMDQEGRLYQGRPFLRNNPFGDGPPLAHGAHVGSNNTGNIGVSLMGCYHPPEGGSCRDEMSPAARDSLLTVFAFLSERYSPGPETMRGHRDFNTTSCPGDNNYRQLGAIRSDVMELLRTGNASIGSATISARVVDAGVVNVEWVFTSDFGIRQFFIERTTDAGSNILFESTTPEDGFLVDSDLEAAGPVAYALAATGASRLAQTLGVVEISIDAQQKIVLTQSFPNPTSDNTVIRYFLDQPGLAKLFLYDLTGRRIAALDEMYVEEDQWHVTHLSTTQLPQGIYYYRLVVDGFAGTLYEAVRPLVVAR